ncbi:MFS transporter [Streptomyces sp. NRRL F-2580]|uniref:MFS transporter n=1 Tax=Streptomyces sp. NRRL F-2580 TaxID=1463841 RepID=UPI0004C5E62C|nr:MFS transporter [Streptomyces sp. NRRL F-2580]
MQRLLRLGRGATFAYFALNGFLMGMWIVHIPVVEQRTGIGHALLGWLLLLLGGGAFMGMRFAGPLADRIGPRRAVPLGASLCSGALVLPALATDAWTLGGALLVLGLGNGVLDVSMNTHAVQVERGYRRPVMSAFHAVFSVGGVLAALVGALTLSAGWSAVTTLALTAVAGLAVAALALPGLLPHQSVSQANEAPEAARAPGSRRTPRRIWFLALLAFMLMLCEGVANDWSVLHLKSVLGAPAATAAFAYGTFATAMTVGRLLTDRLANRFGATAILRYGSALGAAGLALAAFAPIVPLALIGWTLAGAGLSGCIPQLFSAAGHYDAATAGANVSRVAGLGYLGMLAGPAVIGPLTHLIPLNLTLLLPTALCVIAAGVAAPILKPTPSTAARADLEGATIRT